MLISRRVSLLSLELTQPLVVKRDKHPCSYENHEIPINPMIFTIFTPWHGFSHAFSPPKALWPLSRKTTQQEAKTSTTNLGKTLVQARLRWGLKPVSLSHPGDRIYENRYFSKNSSQHHKDAIKTWEYYRLDLWYSIYFYIDTHDEFRWWIDHKETNIQGCPLNFCIKWPLRHVDMHFDCAGSHKVTFRVLGSSWGSAFFL